jgi:hypothetical protein
MVCTGVSHDFPALFRFVRLIRKECISMNYLALIQKKEEEILKDLKAEAKEGAWKSVQGEISEGSEGSPWRGGKDEGLQVSRAVARATPPIDVAIEPAATNAKPIFWERVSIGEILGPAIPEFLARGGEGPTATFWVVAQFDGLPVWINSTQLRSRREFDAQARPAPPVVECIPQVSSVKPETIVVEQPRLEFPDGK